MKFRTPLMAAAIALMAIGVAHAESETVVTKEVGLDGSTKTTTTRYYYNDQDANNNGILDTQEFNTFVYNRWDRNGDGFVTDDEWQASTVRWYPPGYSEYKTYTYWDKDHDGRLDANEFGSVMENTKLYKTWDSDADNVIENSEYAASTFHIYDLDNDGKITLEEWKMAQ